MGHPTLPNFLIIGRGRVKSVDETMKRMDAPILPLLCKSGAGFYHIWVNDLVRTWQAAPQIAGLAWPSSGVVHVNACRCTKEEKDIIFYSSPGLMLFGDITISWTVSHLHRRKNRKRKDDTYQNNWIEPWHNQIMIRGRSLGVGIVNVTQRPRACHNTLISEAEHFFIYRLQHETDVAKIKTILPKKYLSEIYTLPEYHCFYTDNTGIVKPLAPIRLW